MLKKMSALAYQKNDQTLWDAIKEVFELSDKEYLEIQKKAPRWAKSQIMSKKKANEDKSEYELVSASEVCDDFEAAVHKGLNLLAEKNGFKIQQQDIFLKNEAPKSNYQITVKFAKDNTLIITGCTFKPQRLEIDIFFRRQNTQKPFIQKIINVSAHLVLDKLCDFFHSGAKTDAQYLSFLTEYQNV